MITYENVRKVYVGNKEDIVALKDVTLTIEKGNLVVLLGPSGCGKTTLLRLTNRLEKLTSGRIMVKGVDIKTINEVKLRQNMGYVIQQIGLFPNKTIKENVGIVPKLLGWDKKRIDERVNSLLSMVNLDPAVYRNRYPAELSGGQQQRVGVARALGADPDILLMDEPFGAIDPINREHIQNVFLKLQEKLKKTIVFVSHDIHEAIKMGDKIAIFREGQLLQYGTPMDLLAKPENPFVSNFVGADRSLKVLGLIRARDVVNKDCCKLVVQSDTSANEALNNLINNKKRFLIVLKNNKPIGYVDKQTLNFENGKVENIAKAFPGEVEMMETLRDVLSLMLMSGTAFYPVVADNGDFIGIISYNDIQNKLVNIYSEDED
jgi:osmoprotectant transport system ATP-binding protein